MWFDAQLDQKILDGIYSSSQAALTFGQRTYDAKLYIKIAISTQINFVRTFLLFDRLGRQGSTANFCSFVQVSYIWGHFFQIFMSKPNTKLEFLYISCARA